MASLTYVITWVLFSVLVGVAVGYFLGRGSRHARQKDDDHAQQEKLRQSNLQALVELLQSTERLTTDVDLHNSQMRAVSQQVGDMQLPGELAEVQHTLLSEITAVIKCNQRLEDDLVCARARMEEQAEELDRTRREARTDALSGVANRKAFDERLQLLLSTFRRESRQFVLVLLDIDHFKRINDTHGHQAGDRVVAHVGNFLRQLLRPTDFVSRYGGDEFAMLLPDTSLETGRRLIEHLRDTIARHNFDVGENGALATVTFSIGLTAAHNDDSAACVIQRADQGLYKSKQGGRNQLQAISPDAGKAPAAASVLTTAASTAGLSATALPIGTAAPIGTTAPIGGLQSLGTSSLLT